ncbi:hypothetical protein LCGC14_0387210 [marine sediment metagenome]|uniref:Asl1-like glycosyl hydrolase catalytic domain-containing protein n=1 Tax=marine sediment metagenome TaxID=412755 RepID=A0A0F9W9R2_9ZZZZ
MRTDLPSGLAVGIPWQRAVNDPSWYVHALTMLEPNWFYNWKYDLCGQFDNFVPMIWRMNLEWLARALPTIKQYSTHLWLLGNEPERAEQSDTPPEVFAETVRELKRQTGSWVVPIAIPGVLHDYMSGGKNWTQAYLDAGGPLPDYWHIHLYEPNAMMIHSRIGSWKKKFGDGIPIIVSEVASWRRDDNRPQEVMSAIRQALAKGDIHAAAWFSAYYETDMAFSSLLTAAGKLTELGEAFVAEQHLLNLPLVTA